MNKRIIYTTLTIIWIIFIFSFSLQPGDVSGELSSGFGKWLMENVLFGLKGWFESLSTDELEMLHTILRKCAHFSEFFVLGILMLQTIRQWGFSRVMLTSLLVCMAVASVDETIQLFVEARSGQVSDVLLDSAGALVGITLILLIKKNREIGAG